MKAILSVIWRKSIIHSNRTQFPYKLLSCWVDLYNMSWVPSSWWVYGKVYYNIFFCHQSLWQLNQRNSFLVTY